MSDQPEAAPRKSSFLRKVLFFLAAFVISLGIGRAFEYLTTKSTYDAALELQQGWFNSVSTMAPLALATNYFSDVLELASTGRGPVIEVPVLQPATREDEPGQSTGKSGHQCRLLPVAEQTKKQSVAEPVSDSSPAINADYCRNLSLSRRSCLDQLGSPTYDQCEAAQREFQEKFERECAGWEAGIQRTLELQAELPMVSSSPPSNDRRGVGEVLSAPLFAIYYTWARLTASGGISYFWAILQLGAGLIGFLALYGPLFGDRQRGIYLPEGFGGWAIGVPIGTIVVASATAMILKYAMLLGLYLFCQVTSFAAFCCGAAGLVGFCWYWATELAKHSVGTVLTPNDPKQ
ncbi:hypothetical protein [Hoeflea poritis]|uniref:Uncharacterized protein n=1 Tax=Hoeflea poritis TaxID=2993659 RepID=A0ABT4VRE0_9HYPH|nr:hypothetical protein [Hoeflea poritis]MDA4847285.1 hypothetical protein [Hoeflea poritis]